MQAAGSDLNPVYVWTRQVSGDHSEAAKALAVDAAAWLLGVPPAELTLWQEPSGRPRIRCAPGIPEPSVSIGHSDGGIAVAASNAGPVGVDVENVRPLPALTLAERWLDEDETAWLRRLPAERRAEAFLRLWTAKEAVGKALGTGLRGGGMRRPVPLATGPALRAVPGRSDLLVAHPPAGDGMVLAVAVLAVTDLAAADSPIIVRGSPPR